MREYQDLVIACVQVRHNEDKLNMALSGTVRWAVDARVCDEPHTKANLLFQAHFSRLPLPIADYVTDARLVLDNALRLLQAMVDVAVDQGWASNAIATIRIMQVRRSRGLLLAAKSYDRKTPMHTSSEAYACSGSTVIPLSSASLLPVKRAPALLPQNRRAGRARRLWCHRTVAAAARACLVASDGGRIRDGGVWLQVHWYCSANHS